MERKITMRWEAGLGAMLFFSDLDLAAWVAFDVGFRYLQ
jgi:hypothetical protein